MSDWVIAVDKLNKYFGQRHAVKDLSLSIKKGEIFAFLGPNGSGKTTTMRILCGLLTPDSGTGQCLGYDILTQTYHIQLHIGYMTQHFSLYPDLTIEENLLFIARLYGLQQRHKKINAIMAEFNLSDRAKQLTGSLSGGWKQRVALAACLLHKPQLLLLDEPTAGVDPRARREFWDHINKLSQQGITTLVSTHYMDEAERCTRLAYVAYGDLLVQGNIREVISHVGLSTWALQGPNLTALSDTLRDQAGVEELTYF